ncbi:MAG: glycine cleavage system protein GcvH [Actinobacteria bacterium]|nr:glycine cleavage system protein GcvH [Actinomycetota bacterium]
MDVPDNLRYSTDHEWAELVDGELRVGITDYARDALGDVVYVSLPDTGAILDAGSVAGEVESTKAVSEIYSPVAGRVTAVNTSIVENPEILNDDPYGTGWLFRIAPDEPESYDRLLDAGAYRDHISG